MKMLKKLSKLVVAVAVQTLMIVQAFALDAQTIESIVTVNGNNQCTCPQHPDIVGYLKAGVQMEEGDLNLDIPSSQSSGTLKYHIQAADIAAVDTLLTQADQQVSDGAAVAGTQTDAQNVLDEIANKNHLSPNYTDAANILAPFVPYFNILLGLITTIVVLAMSILTALDLCYIAIPAMRNFMSDKAAEGNAAVAKKDGNGGVKLRFISDEAQYAVEQAANNQGSSPWGTYFKSRILSYIFLAVAMVILLTGNITIITDLIVKLVSGIMGVLQGLT